MSGILFARFPTVDYITHSCSFLFMTSSLFKKVPVETESFFSRGRTKNFPRTLLFLSYFLLRRFCLDWNFLEQ